MTNSIKDSKNKSLSELDIVPGQIVAFDNNDYDCPHPFILAIPEKLVKGFENHSRGIRLVYWNIRKGEPREEWTLHTQGKILALWSPKKNYDRKTISPNFKSMINGQEWYGDNAYLVEKAYSGKDSVQTGLQNAGFGLDFYASCMNDGKLITERGMMGKFMKMAGLESLLPNQLRFSLF